MSKVRSKQTNVAKTWVVLDIHEISVSPERCSRWNFASTGMLGALGTEQILNDCNFFNNVKTEFLPGSKKLSPGRVAIRW